MTSVDTIPTNSTLESNLGSSTLIISPREAVLSNTHIYERRDKIVAFCSACAVVGLIIGAFFSQYAYNKKPNETYVVAQPKIIENVPQKPEVLNPFSQIHVGARAAIVYDVQQKKILFAKEEGKKLPLASLTKLMTGLIAYESIQLLDAVTVTPHALKSDGDSGLLANEVWDVEDLISFTMITSSNDGASAIAASIGSLYTSTSVMYEDEYVASFVEKMNKRARELELQNTHFMNPTGLDEPGGGGVGTAEDVSKLLEYIWEHAPETIAYTDVQTKTFISGHGVVHSAQNTNEIVYDIPGLIAGKTGYTDMAGGNLAVLYDAGMNHPIIVVVLGSTRQGRFSDVKTLVDAVYEYDASGWSAYDQRVAGSTKNGLNTSNF